MNKHEMALKWAIQFLTSKKYSIIGYQKTIETSYSVVYKMDTSKGRIYLKQTPKELFLEPTTLAFLNKHHCANVPTYIAQNNDLCCFLMTSVGDLSLRQQFKDSIQLEQVISGILNFTSIQRYLEKNVDELLEIGTLDWRLKNVPSLYLQLIEQDKLLIKDGLDNQEIDQLHHLYDTCINLCDELSSYELPETINHCDFHENNMVLDINSGAISIVDWGETVITHPFFSLNGCLWNITYFYPIKENSKSYELLSAHCVAVWQDLYDAQVLLRVLNTTKKISGIFAALGYQRMYDATRNFSNSVQNENPGSIAGCLRTFLNTFN